MSYCDRSDLIERLSETGLLFVGDDDGSETISSVEMTASLDRAIASASAEIDAALLPWVMFPLDEPSDWLRQRAVDLAAERLAERKGGQVPTSLARAAERSRNWLEKVRLGTLRPPGVVYPMDAYRSDLRGLGLPRVVNPGCDEE